MERIVQFVDEILYLYSGNLRRTEWTEVKEVKEVLGRAKRQSRAKDDSLASENFATKPTAKVTSLTSSEAITSITSKRSDNF